MRNDELTIEGRAVDLGAVNVSLEYVNNLFGDPSKISASHSYTIALPRSAHNERVLDYCVSVAHVSRVVGVPLRASYRRNGIEITRNATAQITGVTPSEIQVALFWDGLSAYTAWLAKAPRLRDLEIPQHRWTGTASAASAWAEEVTEASYNTGVAASIMPPPPCVNVWSMFQRIMNGTGAAWEAPDYRFVEEMKRLVVPLCTRAGGVNTSAGGQWEDMPADTERGGGELYLTAGELIAGSMQTSGPDFLVPSTIDKLTVSVNQEWTVSEYGGGDAPDLSAALFNIYNANGQLVASAPMTETEDGRGVTIAQTFELSGVGASFRMAIETGDADVSALAGSGYITIVPTLKAATVGQMYDIAANLPDLSQIDFVKAVCALFGLQLVSRPDGVLVFASLDDYVDAKAARQYVDLSDKLANYGDAPRVVDFKVEGFAQRNYYKYKADPENLGTDADGVIVSGSQTLEKEKTAVELPFSATRGDTIRHYKAEFDASASSWRVEDQAVNPRILRTYTRTDAKLGARFEGVQYFADILGRYYRPLAAVLAYPVQLQVFARLSEKDLAGLDFLKPVYLRQTGRFYILAKVNADATTDISELTLIQMQ